MGDQFAIVNRANRRGTPGHEFMRGTELAESVRRRCRRFRPFLQRLEQSATRQQALLVNSCQKVIGMRDGAKKQLNGQIGHV